MIGFVNERSLEAHADWAPSLLVFLVAAQELSVTGASLYRDSAFFFGPDFKRRFNSLALPKDQRALITELAFSERYYKCWRPSRISNEVDNYICDGPVAQLRDESISEAAERKIRDDGLAASLLSAAESAFRGQDPVSVSKDGTAQQVELRNLTSVAVVKQWIAEQRGHYDPDSSSAPRDFQTVLVKSPHRFRSTGKVERRFSRQVYEEIETGRLYYVDDAHPGLSAHLEVFSPNREHLGTAHIDTGEVDPSKRKNGRRLKL